MPCISSSWNTFLDIGTPEYESTKLRLIELMDRVKHIIDYYFQVNHADVPEFDYSEFLSLEDTPLQQHSFILDQICFHLACDGMSIRQLYDLRDKELFGTDKHFSVVYFIVAHFRHSVPKIFPKSNYRTLNTV